MKQKVKTKALSEDEIDRIVVAQADDDSAWEKPIKVRPAKSSTMRLPSELAAQAAYFARLHLEKLLPVKYALAPAKILKKVAA